MKVGVISDTHNFFDPQIAKLFQGVQHILHAGDIGLPRILRELEQIAPVTAVSGNTDEAGFHYRETECVEFEGKKFLIHHIVALPHLSEAVQSRIAREKPHVVVFGHTHKPFAEYVGKTLFFNPGYAGKSRFGMERTLAILEYDAEGIRWQYHTL
jgi:uncharacterized protein